MCLSHALRVALPTTRLSHSDRGSAPCPSPESSRLTSLFSFDLKPPSPLVPPPLSYKYLLCRQQWHQLLTHFSCQRRCWKKNCSISNPTSRCKDGTLLGSCNILIPSKKFAPQYVCPLEHLKTCIPAYSPHLMSPMGPCITDA